MAGPAKDAQADGKDRPLYEIVRDQLIGEIKSGAYPAGALLPSVREVTVKWTVSTTTARKVLSELVAAGYARSEGTRGHVSVGPAGIPATAPTSHAPATSPASGLTIRTPQRVTSDGLIAGTTSAVDVRLESAPAEVVLALGLGEPDAQLVVRRTLTVDGNDAPVQLHTAYTLREIAEGTPLADPAAIDLPWPDALAQHGGHGGHRVRSTQRHVAARHPTDSEAAALGLDPTACVLVRSESLHQKERPISYVVTVWPGEATRLTLQDA